MEIKFKKLEIKNFKGCRNREVVFGDNTKIFGANATGKTTLFDALSWILFNHDSLGNTQFDIRPKDKDGNVIHHIEIDVKATMTINDEEYSLRKVQKEKWVKKRGTDTREFQGNVNEFEINGYSKSEKEFKAFISKNVDEKVFNLVTNPTAFASLPWKEQREMLMKFVDCFTDEQIAELYGDKFNSLIPELRIASTDDILKKYTKARNTLNKEMIEIPARIDEVSKQLVIVDVGMLEVERAAKEVELKKVEDELSGDTSKLNEIEKKRKIIMDLKFEASDLENEEKEKLYGARKKALDCAFETKQEQNSLTVKLNSIRDEITTCRRAKEDAASKKEKLINEWKQFKAMHFEPYEEPDPYVPPKELNEKDFICPTCGQKLSDEVRDKKIAEYQTMCQEKAEEYKKKVAWHKEDYEKRKKNFEDNRNNRLKDITEKGQEASDSVRKFEDLICNLTKQMEAIEKELSEVSVKYKEQMESYEKIVLVPDMKNHEKYQDIMKNIEKYEKEIDELSSLSIGNTELEIRKAVIKDEIEDIDMKIVLADNTKINARIAELEAEKKEVGQKIAEMEKMIILTEEFIRVKMNRISDLINENFEVVSFKLFSDQINGGLKETCECTVNGVPYSSLNNGHRIIAGLHICKALSKLYGIKCPVFIDNAEAISEGNMPELDTQVIAMYVTDDKELKIEV